MAGVLPANLLWALPGMVLVAQGKGSKSNAQPNGFMAPVSPACGQSGADVAITGMLLLKDVPQTLL